MKRTYFIQKNQTGKNTNKATHNLKQLILVMNVSRGGGGWGVGGGGEAEIV